MGVMTGYARGPASLAAMSALVLALGGAATAALAQSPDGSGFTTTTSPADAKPTKKAKPAAAKTDPAKPAAKAETAKAKAVPPAGKKTAVAPAAAAAAEPLETGAIGPPAPPLDLKSTKFADWQLDCIEDDGKKRCGLRQTIADGQGRRIVQLMARYSGKTTYLEIIVPLGISIPFGVSVLLTETSKLNAQMADCDKSGCRAVLPLDEKAIGDIKAAKLLTVMFQDSRSGKVLKVNGSLSGFADGVGKVATGA